MISPQPPSTGANTGAQTPSRPYDPCLGAAGAGAPTGLQNQSGVAAPRLLGSTPGSLRPTPSPPFPAIVLRRACPSVVPREAGGAEDSGAVGARCWRRVAPAPP